MLASGVSPAVARDHHRGGYGYGYPGGWGGGPYRYRRHDRGLNAGDVIGIAALIGAVAVIASSASKDRNANRYPDSRNVPDAPNDDYRDGGYRDDDYRGNGDYAPSPGAATNQEEAVNACVAAARDRAESEQGGYAEVRGVDPVRAISGGWSIDGRVELRRNYQDHSGETRRFSCDVKDGQVASVYLSRDAV